MFKYFPLFLLRDCVKITDMDDEWFCQSCENLNNEVCVVDTVAYLFNSVPITLHVNFSLILTICCFFHHVFNRMKSEVIQNPTVRTIFENVRRDIFKHFSLLPFSI